MDQAKSLKPWFLALWLLLTTIVVATLASQRRFAAAKRQTVASIQEKSGHVTVRAEDLVAWQSVGVDVGLFDGDNVATGRASRSTIGFGPGRILTMDERTQIQITAIQQTNSANAYLITLLRGKIVASVAKTCAGCPPLILRAGDDTFTLTTGKQLGLIKAVDKKVKKFNPKL